MKAFLHRKAGDQEPRHKSATRSWFAFCCLVLCFAFSSRKVEGAILNKDQALAAQTFWDNRDFDWFKANIPFFDCPDADIVTTYYYRWELITKHLTYGSPTSGYSFTEFIDRPFWSGAYGAISCPAGHQIYEVRWLNDRRLAQDYARYWFRTEGAQPRRYSTWLADAVWATHLAQDDPAFAKDLLRDLIANYEGWEKTHFVPEVGLFWQIGHDDGMEYNIASRQTKAIFNGAPSYRPSFNAYMWADAKAIARIADLAGDNETSQKFRAKADALKTKMQSWLWDPKREFFLIRFKNDEECDPKNWPGQKIKANTLIYEDGPFAGSGEGRELIGYVPWQFNMLDSGKFESAWKFLMDPKYFYAPFGPSFVGRNDPLFKIMDRCCWWSGQSWPYANAQTLKAMANLLHEAKQQVVSREDYVKLLHIYAATHRKNGKPYIAEAAHPDTGSWEGHDGYNHSEHYFHSSFNDLIITGLVGLKPRADDVIEIDPLATRAWDYFALEDVFYHGRKLTVVWDKDGKCYGQGAGLRVLVDGMAVAQMNTLGKISAKLPTAKPPPKPAARTNFAVNNSGEIFPRAISSSVDNRSSTSKLNDGNYWYTPHPPNRWVSGRTGRTNDSIAIDLKSKRTIDEVRLYFLDDGTELVAPAAFRLQTFNGRDWQDVPNQKRVPEVPTGHRANVIKFSPIITSGVRAILTHRPDAAVGASEFEAWGPAESPYMPVPPRPHSLAFGRGRDFPKATASYSDRYGGQPNFAIDGRINFDPMPMNRWTSYGSTNATDWLEVDFGLAMKVNRADLFIYDDGGGVQAPAKFDVIYWANGEWRVVEQAKRDPERPTGRTVNDIKFSEVTTQKIRIVFTHKGQARSGVTELELWRD